MFEHVDKFSRKKIYLRKWFELEGICTTNLDCVTFYWILAANLLDSDLQLPLLDNLLRLDLKKASITNLDCNLDCILRDLELKLLELLIWISIVIY